MSGIILINLVAGEKALLVLQWVGAGTLSTLQQGSPVKQTIVPSKRQQHCYSETLHLMNMF